MIRTSLFCLLLAANVHASIIMTVIPSDRPTENVVWFPDPQQWNRDGLVEFCQRWPAACILERVDLFGELGRPQVGELSECRPAALYGRSNIYLIACVEAEDSAGALSDPPDPPDNVVPEPGYAVVVGSMLVGVGLVRRWRRSRRSPQN